MNQQTLEYYYKVARCNRNGVNDKRYEAVITLLRREAGELRLSAKNPHLLSGAKNILLSRCHAIENEIRKIERGL